MLYRFLWPTLATLLWHSTARAQEVRLTVCYTELQRDFTNALHESRVADSNGLAVHSANTGVQEIRPGQKLSESVLHKASRLKPVAENHLCPTAAYTPAWWLAPDVEVRRAIHFGAMASIACEFGIPTSLLDATVAQESGYRNLAISHAGARGMLQIMPATAKSLGLTNPFDPIANLRAGARYLRQQIDRFGRIDLALAAYNAGPERPSLLAGRIPNIRETREYVSTIIMNWERLSRRRALPGWRAKYEPRSIGPVLRQVDIVHFNAGLGTR